MSVTYQVNYLVKFSEYVCDISGKLYHFIIPFSGDVSDISGQLPCQIIFLYFLLREREREFIQGDIVLRQTHSDNTAAIEQKFTAYKAQYQT